MPDKVVVALNALINPDIAGGSESSALSIVVNFRDAADPGIDMFVVAFPQYAEKMRAIRGAPDRVIEWPWPEFTVVSSEFRSGWARRLRTFLGDSRLGRMADTASQARNERAFLRQMPTRTEIDLLLDRYNIDVAHFTYPVKWPTRRPYLFEPHDIQQCHFPEFFPLDVLRWRQVTYTDGIRNSAFVVCGTWWTKRDIMRNFGVPASKVAVVPRSSVKARTDVTAAEEAKLASEAHLPERYMFYPAMTFPHKNHLRLFEAMAILRDRRGLRLNLICSGRAYKPFHPTLLREVERLKLSGQVRFLGTVSDEMLATCYRRASFVVFPSLLEGHSQSLLEALYHRKPIVGATQSSVPETIGSAGYLFDATDIEAMADALEIAWTDPALLARLSANAAGSFGRNRWDRALLTLTACYKSAAGRNLSEEERAALDRALLEEKPEDA